MPNVVANADGTFTAGADVYDTLREALDAALPLVATFEKPLYFRDAETGELNGEMRWLPACDVEGAPLRGIRIDAEAIEEMAASLNANPRAIPINGGPTPPGLLPSQPHGDIVDSSTLANGRAQWGLVVEQGATTELYLFSEVMPHIARELDVGRLAEGSVCFDWQTTEQTDAGPVPRGVELISHAFTNDPAVKTLAPANSVRGGYRVHPLTGALRAARHRGARPMAKITVRAGLTAIVNETAKKAGKDAAAVRGPALDKLAQLCALVGVEMDDEMSAKEWESPLSRAVCVVKDAAMEEKILEPAAPVASATARSRSTRTLPGLDQAQSDAWAMDILAQAQRLVGKPDATPAEVLDLMKAGADGALGGNGNGGDPTATDQQGQGDAGNMTANETQRAARAEMNGLKSSVQALEARVATQDKELAGFRARELRAAVRDQITHAAIAAKRVVVRGEGLDAAIEDAAEIANPAARGRYIDGYVAKLAPGEMAMAEDKGDRTGSETGGEGAALTADEAVESEKAKLVKEGVRGAELYRRALENARKAHPKAFTKKAG